MRARLPDHEGFAERDGVKIRYEVHGDGEPTVLLLPCWTFIDSRVWKGQYAYLARHFRVVLFDPRGSLRSDTPVGWEAYSDAEMNGDAIAVMDATSTEQAVVVGLSMGGRRALRLAADHPDRVLGAVASGPAMAVGSVPLLTPEVWGTDIDEPELLTHFNRGLWQRPEGFDTFITWFQHLVHTEPDSSWPIEEAVGWAAEIPPESSVDQFDAHLREPSANDPSAGQALLARIERPVLLLNGSDDFVTPLSETEQIPDLVDADLVVFESAGHNLPGRHPAQFNLEVRRFAESLRPVSALRPGRQRSWRRALSRPRRVLYLSSPIGLGHARRDLAIARELRSLHPDVEIDWLTEHPVTAMLEAHGERVHPMSKHLASQSGHLESESAEHDLHCFQAIREMDQIMVNNAMVFHDLVDAEHYDLVVGDEAFDVDHLLREMPELKRAPYVWLSDFAGFLPFPDGGDYEARIAAEHNAYVIDGIERFPTLRDHSIFVGNAEDIVPGTFGADLPVIRDWVSEWFSFSGHVTGFDPIEDDERAELRARLGYRDDERVCVVAVGGTGVGVHLLERVIAAQPLARRLVPDLRMVVVTGPRLDPAAFAPAEGLEIHGFVPDLYQHLAACDVAVVQGGLTTAMELTANRRPFLVFPLAHHFEQQFHVRHRIERYGAGRYMDYDAETAESIAHAIAEEAGREVDYLPVETDGAARAATILADLL